MNGLVFPGGQALPAANLVVAPQPDFTQAARYQAPTAIVPSMPARQPLADPARATPKQSLEPSTSLIISVQGVPVVQNITATVNLGCRLDLKTITLNARNAEYNPKRFAAVIMKLMQPKTTALIFASGKMVITGAKSEDDAHLAARKFARLIQKLGFDAQFKEFEIQNMMGTCAAGFPIRLKKLYEAHPQFASWQPELFPGVVYRMMKPKVTLLIFVSGKVVLTGAKTREDIHSAFDKIYPVLLEWQSQAKRGPAPEVVSVEP